MKKIYLLLFLISLAALVKGQQDEYSTAVTLINQSEDLLVMHSVGLSDKKKTAVDMAIKSTFYTLFYRGVNGFNSGKPLVTNNNVYYFDKFMKSRYMMFVSQYTEGEVENIKNTKQYRVEVEVSILIKSLIKDLVFENLMERPLSDITMEETKQIIGLPSITVVPYKTDDENYQNVLQNDFDRRMAVSRVQQGFNQLGVTTIDFEAKLNAVWRSADFNSDVADSEEKRLLRITGADIYVIVDLNKDISATEGSRVSLNMKAYETVSGNILSATQQWTNRFHTTDLDRLCVYAVEGQLKSFLDDIALNFAKQIQGGSSVVLRIAQGAESKNSLNTSVEGSSLSSVIRRWVRQNAENGQYHIQGVVAEEMIFDDIKIPSVDVDGYPMDPAQFGDNLLYYISKELKLPCEMKLDGRSIYITLK